MSIIEGCGAFNHLYLYNQGHIPNWGHIPNRLVGLFVLSFTAQSTQLGHVERGQFA